MQFTCATEDCEETEVRCADCGMPIEPSRFEPEVLRRALAECVKHRAQSLVKEGVAVLEQALKLAKKEEDLKDRKAQGGRL